MTKLKSGFPRWWHCFGSGIIQSFNEDHEEHVKSVAESAYNAGRMAAMAEHKVRQDKRLGRILMAAVAVVGLAGGAKLVTALADSYENRTTESIRQ